MQAQVLVQFDPLKELKLECDASPYGVGAALFHTSNGMPKPIGFRSRTLTAAEKNYSQLEREALALVFGVTKFRDYLLGRQFTLVTDHQPLLSLLQSDRPTPPLAAARIQRWALYLGGYRYKLQYTPGKQLLNADALSRLPLRSTEADDVDSPPASDDWVVPMESNVYVRNYGVGEKWTPGRVQSTAGSRMVTVQTPHSVVRRHVDQVRPRQASQSPSPGSASLSESNMSMLPKRSPGPSTTSSTVLPPEALTTASPHDHPVPTMPQAGPTQAATPSAEPVLRRSTRQRKPVQRFHF
ncbi:uncharacterized protein LOC142802112 [Rhipicephalus microplus]|uniref:uncharacterized protein LOC142802112 n=1 Tax=Rhipicephalus microplus TaxID=6941 RepID=UPI003F6CE20B